MTIAEAQVLKKKYDHLVGSDGYFFGEKLKIEAVVISQKLTGVINFSNPIETQLDSVTGDGDHFEVYIKPVAHPFYFTLREFLIDSLRRKAEHL